MELTTSTQTLDFGNPPLGQVYQDSFQINNPGEAALMVDSIRSTGPFRANWSGFIQPGTDKNIKVVFTPEGIESYTDTIVIHSDAVSSPDTVIVNAAGGGAILNPSAGIDFGMVLVDSLKTDTAYLKNDGNIDLTVSGITSPDGFSVDWESGFIAPGDSQQLVITFAPTEAGEYTGAIRINSDALEGLDSIPVNGVGEVATSLTDPRVSMPIMQVFPNPSDVFTQVRISQFDGHPSLLLNLFTPDGKRIQSWVREGSSGEWLIPIDLAELPAGMYSLELSGKDWARTQQLIVR